MSAKALPAPEQQLLTVVAGASVSITMTAIAKASGYNTSIGGTALFIPTS